MFGITPLSPHQRENTTRSGERPVGMSREVQMHVASRRPRELGQVSDRSPGILPAPVRWGSPGAT